MALANKMKSLLKREMIRIKQSSALKFVVLFGLVSLFADMTYEGARSVTGPYLAELGANAVIVGFVAGFGEFLGYTLRLFSGYLIDKTARYWTVVGIGYILNLLAVPLLALSNHWQIAAVLIIIERIGKGIRIPARDAMLAHSAQRLKRPAWVFGLHEAFDRFGAMLGPLLIALVLFFKGDYRSGFALLLFPAIIALSILLTISRIYPRPQDLELDSLRPKTKGMDSTFWLYIIATSFMAAGFADFSLMAFHFVKKTIVGDTWIPIFYALAMGLSGVAAFLFGYLFDRKGFIVLIMVTIIASFFAPLVFLGDMTSAFIGVCLWSIGLGTHESLMRAFISKLIPSAKRGSAYGVFNAAFGLAWFLGSLLMGFLYEISILSLVIFSMAAQFIAAVFLFAVMRKIQDKDW